MFGKDIISIDQFDKETLESIYDVSFFIEHKIREEGTLDILKGKTMASLFFEPSTRTRFSFESAMQKLGGNIVSATGVSFSSMAKGETLEDTIKTVERYSDVVVIRHPEEGSAKIAAESASIPIINAGDGQGEIRLKHCLTFTLSKKRRRAWEGLKITLVGDLKHGRTIHSLLKLLSNYENLCIYLVSPSELRIPKKYIDFIKEKGLEFTESESLEEVIGETDILYMTRIQKERFESQEQYEKLKNAFTINKYETVEKVPKIGHSGDG